MRGKLGRVWTVFCSLAATIVAAGLILAGFDFAYGLRPKKTFSQRLDAVPYFAEQPWKRQFVADHEGIASARVEYYPFTVLRRPPYASSTVNVDSDGRRVVPGSSCEEEAPRVFFFGGSAMWGTGSPDGGTIPAIFVRDAAPLVGGRLCVSNYGESAWASTQSVIALMNALQQGDVPDLVIFYEGANDLNWAFSNDTPYRHADYSRIAALFNGAARRLDQYRFRATDVAAMARAIAPNLAAMLDERRQWGGGPSDHSPEGLARLANAALDVYLANQRIVRGLAREYGFRCHFFWQPYLIYGHKPLAPGESRLLKGAAQWVKTFGPFAAVADARIAGETQADFSDLSGVFEKTTDQIYVDMVHVTPEGNAIVTSAIIAAIRDTLTTLRRADRSRGDAPPLGSDGDAAWTERSGASRRIPAALKPHAVTDLELR